MVKQEITESGVIVPREIVEQSNATKKHHRSLRQTEVYRDACNLKYIIVKQVLNSYLGFCKGRRTYSIRKRYIERMGAGFWKHFYVRGSFKSVRLRRQYRLLN